MHDEPIRQHIEALATRSPDETSHLTARMLRACWPGGSDDRTEPGALGWVSRWRPDRLGATLPPCSCSAGRCVVCN